MLETGIAAGTVISAMIGIFFAIYKHTSNTDRHPAKRDLVFRDVCKPKMDRLEDQITNNQECVEKDIQSLKELMIQRFENLETLVRSNGKQPPRVST